MQSGAPAPDRRSDPLLSVVRLLIWVSMALGLVIAIVLALSVPAMPLWWEPVHEGLLQRASGPLPENLQYMIAGSLAFAAGAAALGFYFFRQLLRIVDTIGEGDPFIPDNAARLQRMGWAAVALQLLAFPASGVTGWIGHVTRIGYIDGRFSLGGILLALILFVLARVFREGNRMREDLEGTV